MLSVGLEYTQTDGKKVVGSYKSQIQKLAILDSLI